jgi:hypothetical protein
MLFSVLTWITSLVALAVGVLAFLEARRASDKARKVRQAVARLKGVSSRPPLALPPIVRTTPPSSYLSVVAIVRDGVGYLDEWITFHQMVGCDRFYVYDNKSSDGTWELLQRYESRGIVTPIRWPDSQRGAYAHALTTFGPTSRWMMFIDTDEFVFPTRSDSLQQELQRYEDLPCVVLPWHMFGHSGHKVRPPGLVIENYTMRSAIPHPSKSPSVTRALTKIKSIVDPVRTRAVKTHNFPNDEGQVYYALDRKPFRRGKWTPSDSDSMVLNHYFTRSEEEWEAKLQRGGGSQRPPADMRQRRNAVRDAIERASVEDRRIQRFVPGLKALLNRAR